jgi:hypothetical protein
VRIEFVALDKGDAGEGDTRVLGEGAQVWCAATSRLGRTRQRYGGRMGGSPEGEPLQFVRPPTELGVTYGVLKPRAQCVENLLLDAEQGR